MICYIVFSLITIETDDIAQIFINFTKKIDNVGDNNNNNPSF